MAPTATQFEILPPPGECISALSFAPGNGSNRLLGSCWDRSVYLYDIHDDGSGPKGTLIQNYKQKNVVLDVCFGKDDHEAFTASLDGTIQRIDLDSGDHEILGKHSKGASCLVYSAEHRILVSGSWDGTLYFFRTSDLSRPPVKIQLPGKVFAVATSPTKLVVAMAARLVHIYDLPALASYLASAPLSPGGEPIDATGDIKPWQERESSLKFLTRSVACMPNDAGYATSSTEGRVAVEWFDDSAESQARKYAFKCHRHPANDEEGGDIVYPVNALVFHPKYGTFASGGGDGTVALWDAEAKRRMKQYQRTSNSVWALDFSKDGRYLAIAAAPGFETNQKEYSGEGKTHIYVRELSDAEAKGKGSK